MKRAEAFPSKYLKADDLNGKPVVLTIQAAKEEVLKTPDGKEQTKVVVYFKGMRKGLPLNMTNFDSIVAITGRDDSTDWPGFAVEAYPTKVEMKGKMTDAIRLREPEQADMIAKAKTKPKTRTKRLPQEDDLDERAEVSPQCQASAETTHGRFRMLGRGLRRCCLRAWHIYGRLRSQPANRRRDRVGGQHRCHRIARLYGQEAGRQMDRHGHGAAQTARCGRGRASHV